jgi:hypothetical protein
MGHLRKNATDIGNGAGLLSAAIHHRIDIVVPIFPPKPADTAVRGNNSLSGNPMAVNLSIFKLHRDAEIWRKRSPDARTRLHDLGTVNLVSVHAETAFFF